MVVLSRGSARLCAGRFSVILLHGDQGWALYLWQTGLPQAGHAPDRQTAVDVPTGLSGQDFFARGARRFCGG
jgi:hypothetical protein